MELEASRYIGFIGGIVLGAAGALIGFLIGFLTGLAINKGLLSSEARLFLITGTPPVMEALLVTRRELTTKVRLGQPELVQQASSEEPPDRHQQDLQGEPRQADEAADAEHEDL